MSATATNTKSHEKYMYFSATTATARAARAFSERYFHSPPPYFLFQRNLAGSPSDAQPQTVGHELMMNIPRLAASSSSYWAGLRWSFFIG